MRGAKGLVVARSQPYKFECGETRTTFLSVMNRFNRTEEGGSRRHGKPCAFFGGGGDEGDGRDRRTRRGAICLTSALRMTVLCEQGADFIKLKSQ